MTDQDEPRAVWLDGIQLPTGDLWVDVPGTELQVRTRPGDELGHIWIRGAPGSSPWMTRQEAADYLRVDVRTVDRWVKEGRLGRHKIKGIQSVRFSRAEIERQIEPDPEA